MASLLNRVRRTGFLVLLGLVVIIYVALAVLYFQQASQQNKFTEQIIQLQTVTAKPLAGMTELRDKYKQTTDALATISPEEILKHITGVAKASGIEIEPGAGKFTFPRAGAPKIVRVGVNEYQVISFTGIKVEGDNGKVMDFITRLDSGAVLNNFVLKRVSIENASPTDVDDRAARSSEYDSVRAALLSMMTDNRLSSIPNPINPYASGNASNDMSAFPDTFSSWLETPGGKVKDVVGNFYATGNRLRTEGDKFWAEGDALIANGNMLIAKGNMLVVEGGGIRAKGKTLWEEGNKLWEEGNKLWEKGNMLLAVGDTPGPEGDNPNIEGNRLITQGANLMTQGRTLMIEGHDLMAGGDGREAEGKRLLAEGNGLLAEGKSLWAEGDRLWAESTQPWEEGDKVGYVLYQHDSQADSSKSNLVNYIASSTTRYYYTAEANGRLRQFDGPDVKTAKEYIDLKGAKSSNVPGVVAVLDIDLYSLPPAASKSK